MFWTLMVVQLVVSILLMIVVLMQSSKGGGLAGTFGGGSVGVVLGVRRTADFLIKATQVLATTFIILSLVINLFFLPRGAGGSDSVIQRGAQQTPVTPQLPPQTTPELGN
jgi:preprotein translocase subunit SecG